jgi:hypothetical protein
MGPQGERGPTNYLAVVGYLILTLAIAFSLYRVSGLASQGEEAHQGLCVLRADLENRVQTSRDFLKEHPEGIPGIPVATIRQSIDNQQKTIDALEVLDCA